MHLRTFGTVNPARQIPHGAQAARAEGISPAAGNKAAISALLTGIGALGSMRSGRCSASTASGSEKRVGQMRQAIDRIAGHPGE
jgi:hypothetical protein